MDPKVTEILSKVASYIEATQPELDQYTEQRTAFVKRATEVAGVLAKRGVIDQRRVNAFVDKVASDPASAWDFIEKLAGLVGTDSMGEVGRDKVASSGDNQDPWERRFFGDLNDARGTGLVD
jgi:hypothetical protein